MALGETHTKNTKHETRTASKAPEDKSRRNNQVQKTAPSENASIAASQKRRHGVVKPSKEAHVEGSSHHHICRGTARRESTRNSSNRGKHERFDGLHVSPLANPQLNNNKKCATTTTPPPALPSQITPIHQASYMARGIVFKCWRGMDWNGMEPCSSSTFKLARAERQRRQPRQIPHLLRDLACSTTAKQQRRVFVSHGHHVGVGATDVV